MKRVRSPQRFVIRMDDGMWVNFNVFIREQFKLSHAINAVLERQPILLRLKFIFSFLEWFFFVELVMVYVNSCFVRIWTHFLLTPNIFLLLSLFVAFKLDEPMLSKSLWCGINDPILSPKVQISHWSLLSLRKTWRCFPIKILLANDVMWFTGKLFNRWILGQKSCNTIKPKPKHKSKVLPKSFSSIARSHI